MTAIASHFEAMGMTAEQAASREALFAQLDSLGYAGFVGCEYRPRAGTLEGLGWFSPWKKHA